MAAGTNIDAVKDLYNTAQEYLKQLNDWKQKSYDALALVKEYERQKAEHEAKHTLQGQQDAENVSVLLNVAYGKNGEAQNNVVKYQGLYDAAYAAWQNQQKNLSPAEVKQLSAAQDAETAQQQAEAAALMAASSNKLFAQKNTQYIIIGGVIIMIIVVGVLIWKKVLHK